MDNFPKKEDEKIPECPKPSPKAPKRKTCDVRDLAQDLEQMKKDMKKD